MALLCRSSCLARLHITNALRESSLARAPLRLQPAAPSKVLQPRLSISLAKGQKWLRRHSLDKLREQISNLPELNMDAFEDEIDDDDIVVDLDWNKYFRDPYPELKALAQKEARWMERELRQVLVEMGEEPKLASDIAGVAADVVEFVFSRTEIVAMTTIWEGVAAEVLKKGLKEHPDHVDVGLEAAFLIQNRYPDRNDYRSDGPNQEAPKQEEEGVWSSRKTGPGQRRKSTE